MLYTIIGDPHCKPGNLDKIDKLFDIIEDLGNDTIILGDLLDSKEVIRGKCLNKYIERFRKSSCKFIVLTGNHDWFNLQCEDHSLEPLKTLPNVKVVDSYYSLGNLAFMPYGHIAPTDFTGKILFCHVDLIGFDYGNGFISEKGDLLEDFSKAKRVISGHYHKYQTSGNFTYLGTPFSHSFGESNQEKFIGLYNTETDNLELLPSPFPRHLTIELDCDKDLSHPANDFDHVRVVLKGSQEHINQVRRNPNVKYIEKPTESLVRSVVSEIDSTEVQFTKWAKEVKGYSEELTDLGLELLKDVQ